MSTESNDMGRAFEYACIIDNRMVIHRKVWYTHTCNNLSGGFILFGLATIGYHKTIWKGYFLLKTFNSQVTLYSFKILIVACFILLYSFLFIIVFPFLF